MNCKPGDLAIVVGIDTVPHWRGCIVQVSKVCNVFPLPHWFTVPERRDPDGVLVVFADDDLRPIRDPGDDATDETLLWLPVPTKETA